MKQVAYKTGQRLMRLRYVRCAVEEQASLDAFRQRPSLSILLGTFLIPFSFTFGAPVLATVLPAAALYFKQAWILLLFVPLYLLSHGCFILGMFLSGEKYSRILFRWMTRKGAERLLRCGEKVELATDEHR